MKKATEQKESPKIEKVMEIEDYLKLITRRHISCRCAVVPIMRDEINYYISGKMETEG